MPLVKKSLVEPQWKPDVATIVAWPQVAGGFRPCNVIILFSTLLLTKRQ